MLTRRAHSEDGDSGDEGIKSVPTTKTEKPAVVGAPKKVAPAPNAAKANQQAQAGNRKDNYPGRTGQGRKVLSEDGPREGKENTKRAGGGEFCPVSHRCLWERRTFVFLRLTSSARRCSC